MNCLLEHDEVLVHLQLDVAADESAHRIGAQQGGGIEHSQHELVLVFACGRIVHEHVVEVAQVGKTDARGLHRLEHTGRPVLVEGRAQVERVGHRIEHRLLGDIAQGGMQRGGELNVRRTDVSRELQPFFDRQVRIGVAPIARCQLLKRGGQHAELHRPGSEVSGGHGSMLMWLERSVVRKKRNGYPPIFPNSSSL